VTGPTGPTGPIGPQGYSGWPYLDGGDPFSDFSLQPQNPGVQSVNAIAGNVLLTGSNGISVVNAGQTITFNVAGDGASKIDVSATITLAADAPKYQLLSPQGGPKTIYLPADAAPGRVFVFKNMQMSYPNYYWYLNIKDSATNGTLRNLYGYEGWYTVLYDGDAWIAI
jgi:hypothetical protein